MEEQIKYVQEQLEEKDRLVLEMGQQQEKMQEVMNTKKMLE